MLSRLALIQPVLTKPFHRDGWVFEEKYDAWRMVAYKDGRKLVSRRGTDIRIALQRLRAQLHVCRPARSSSTAVCVFDE